MKPIQKVLPPPWLFAQGASPEVLDELRSVVGALPPSYLQLLSAGNGGEVGLSINPFTLCLDTAESALGYWRSGACPMPGVFVFGGDGGGELLAFDLKDEKWPVICFDPIDPEGSIRRLAPDFESLLMLLVAHGAEGGR